MNARDYAARVEANRRFPRHWRDFFFALMPEVNRLDNAAEFLRNVGTGMGEMARTEIGRTDTLAQLEAGLNAYLAAVDWGWLVMREEGGFLMIRHSGYPAAGRSLTTAEHGLIHVLEGFYTDVLNKTAGAPDLSARCLAPPQSSNDPIPLAYGSHADANPQPDAPVQRPVASSSNGAASLEAGASSLASLAAKRKRSAQP